MRTACRRGGDRPHRSRCWAWSSCCSGRPRHLSGGEKSRVALGRALLASPDILLLDEPLASLDAARRAEILPWLERLRDIARMPIFYVSHSLDEVARLADQVVLLDDGRVTASGQRVRACWRARARRSRWARCWTRR